MSPLGKEQKRGKWKVEKDIGEQKRRSVEAIKIASKELEDQAQHRDIYSWCLNVAGS